MSKQHKAFVAQRAAKRRADATIAQEMHDLFGDPDEWTIPEADIERILQSGPCEHGKATLDDCQPCLVRELLRRQIELLALRMGCTPADAKQVADELIAEHRGTAQPGAFTP